MYFIYKTPSSSTSYYVKTKTILRTSTEKWILEWNNHLIVKKALGQ